MACNSLMGYNKLTVFIPAECKFITADDSECDLSIYTTPLTMQQKYRSKWSVLAILKHLL